MDFIRPAINLFWTESVWITSNITWPENGNSSNVLIVDDDYRTIVYPIPMALFVYGLRKLLERFWFAPFGISLGIKNIRPRRSQKNDILESAYQKQARLHSDQAIRLSKQLDWSERQVERWWRLRRSEDKPTTLVKFCENSWRLLYYTNSFIFGCFILHDKSWFFDIGKCWDDYPHHQLTGGICWYYMASLSFYWSLAVSQFFDVRRKDFWQMFTHHAATILLLTVSWYYKLYRFGTIVLMIHDSADIILESAKLTKYANYHKVCDILFGLFTVTWIVTRLGIFPFWVMYNTLVAPPVILMTPVYLVLNGLLFLLLCLHIVWTYIIIQVAFKALADGKMDGDCRSSSSELSEVSDRENNARAAARPC